MLLFPQKRFHALLKDEKLLTGEMNNPATDALKARDLFFEELTAWQKLAPAVRTILAALLSRDIRYRGFFAYAGETPAEDSAENLALTIREAFPDAFCANANLPLLIKTKPADLGLVLAFLAAGDSAELLPLWTVKTFPAAEDVLTALCGTPCRAGCPWCSRTFNARHGLPHLRRRTSAGKSRAGSLRGRLTACGLSDGRRKVNYLSDSGSDAGKGDTVSHGRHFTAAVADEGSG